ncbi:hypothetical protein LJR143_003918 [Pseudoxanthomonas sp. LjRoot143]|uniref:hypothetical protein n=1 Tax=Pseudoxanthomonas sp. LjRoot143 TaxID=3342266 RepID=UPI003ECF1F5E
MASKIWVLLGFLGLSFIAGVVGQYYYPGVEFSPVDIWLLPVFAFLLFLWYRIDSEQRSYRRSPWLNASIIAVAIIALPYYFFRSRGLKGGAFATTAMLLVFVLSGVLTVAGQYSAYYGLQS